MATVQIDVDGVDITDDVVIAEASFSSFVNGTPGTCSFMVKDTPGTRTITTGKDITLWIDGSRNWRGFVSQVARAFLFDAEDTAGKTERFFRVTGADVNVLFRKRIIVNQSDPLNGGKIYKFSGTKTSDQTALDELFANWIDLSGDGLTTLSTGTGGGIEFVGYINEDQDTEPWQAGWTWGQAMDAIAMLPAAIYYIDPDKVVVYTDAGGTGVSGEIDLDPADANAPFILVDDPTANLGIDTPALGYADMEILADGNNLATDVLVWGMGTGSDKPVFTRVQDDPESHGRWQHGEVHYNVYKQGTTDRIASSVLRGSATSRRGHRRDKIAVSCVVWEPGFRVAQKVVFVSFSYSFAAILPIRKVEISFPEGNPKWELTLSSEIDAPWTFYDVFNIKLPDLQNFDVPFGIGHWKPDGGPPISGGGFGSAPGHGPWFASNDWDSARTVGPSTYTTDEVRAGLGAPWSDTDPFYNGWAFDGGPFKVQDVIGIDQSLEATIDDPDAWVGEWLLTQGRWVSSFEYPLDPAVYPQIKINWSVTFTNGTNTTGHVPASSTPINSPWTLYIVGLDTDVDFGEDFDLLSRSGFSIASGSGPASGSTVISAFTGVAAFVLRADMPSEVPARIASYGVTYDHLFETLSGWLWEGDSSVPSGGAINGIMADLIIAAHFSYDATSVPLPNGGGGQKSTGGFTGTTLQLDTPYAFGSPKVFKNGKILARDIDYTETAPLAGTITLAVAALVTDRWNVIYRIVNPLGGAGLPARLRTSYS